MKKCIQEFTEADDGFGELGLPYLKSDFRKRQWWVMKFAGGCGNFFQEEEKGMAVVEKETKDLVR